MANPAINRVQGECGCGGARFLHQRCEFLETLGLSMCQYLLCSEGINFMTCMSAKIVVI